MLNKETCRKCYSKHVSKWDYFREDDWEARPNIIVICCSGGSFIDAMKDPPKECEHKLEHAVAAGMNSAK